MSRHTHELGGHTVVYRPPRHNWYEVDGELVHEKTSKPLRADPLPGFSVFRKGHPQVRIECVYCDLTAQGGRGHVENRFALFDCTTASDYRIDPGGPA